MVLDKPRAGTMLMVQGGEKNSKSIKSTMEGMAWKLISAFLSVNTSHIEIQGRFSYPHREESQPIRGSPNARRSETRMRTRTHTQ